MPPQEVNDLHVRLAACRVNLSKFRDNPKWSGEW